MHTFVIKYSKSRPGSQQQAINMADEVQRLVSSTFHTTAVGYQLEEIVYTDGLPDFILEGLIEDPDGEHFEKVIILREKTNEIMLKHASLPCDVAHRWVTIDQVMIVN